MFYKGYRCLTSNNVCFTCVFPLLVGFSGDLLRSTLMGGKKKLAQASQNEKNVEPERKHGILESANFPVKG